MTSLLDVLKETKLRVGFPDVFKSLGTREVLDRETLQHRLLLCLYGLGTDRGSNAWDQAITISPIGHSCRLGIAFLKRMRCAKPFAAWSMPHLRPA